LRISQSVKLSIPLGGYGEGGEMIYSRSKRKRERNEEILPRPGCRWFLYPCVEERRGGEIPLQYRVGKKGGKKGTGVATAIKGDFLLRGPGGARERGKKKGGVVVSGCLQGVAS